jgi:hypothetical protein
MMYSAFIGAHPRGTIDADAVEEAIVVVIKRMLQVLS